MIMDMAEVEAVVVLEDMVSVFHGFFSRNLKF